MSVSSWDVSPGGQHPLRVLKGLPMHRTVPATERVWVNSCSFIILFIISISTVKIFPQQNIQVALFSVTYVFNEITLQVPSLCLQKDHLSTDGTGWMIQSDLPRVTFKGNWGHKSSAPSGPGAPQAASLFALTPWRWEGEQRHLQARKRGLHGWFQETAPSSSRCPFPPLLLLAVASQILLCCPGQLSILPWSV